MNVDYELSFAALVAIVSLVAIISLAVLFSHMHQEQVEQQRLAELAMQDVQPVVNVIEDVSLPECTHRYTTEKACQINHYKKSCTQCEWSDGTTYWDVVA